MIQKRWTEKATPLDFIVKNFHFFQLSRIINVSVDCTLELLYPWNVWDVRV